MTYPLLRVPEACTFLRTEFGMSYSPRPFRGKGIYFGYLVGIVLLRKELKTKKKRFWSVHAYKIKRYAD